MRKKIIVMSLLFVPPLSILIGGSSVRDNVSPMCVKNIFNCLVHDWGICGPGKKKIIFVRHVLEYVIFMGLLFVSPPSTLTDGSSARGKEILICDKYFQLF